MTLFLTAYHLADVLLVHTKGTFFRKESLCVIKLKASRQNMGLALIRLSQPIH